MSTYMTDEEAARIQPGDVVYFRERDAHFVVGRVRPTGIAAPLFHLEAIGSERPDNDPGLTSYKILGLPREGVQTRAPYRGGRRYSERTLRERGELVHPIPGDESRPDEARDWFTVAETAGRLGLSAKSVNKAIDRGTLPAKSVNPRLYLISADEIENYRSEHLGKRGRPKRP